MFYSAMDSVKDPGRLLSKPALEANLLELARLLHLPNKHICVGYERLLNTMGSRNHLFIATIYLSLLLLNLN